MLETLIIVGASLTILAAISIVGFFLVRKTLREAKNYERGLKMVPMLIQLPPSSEDTEVGGRDEREVSEQVISEAQTLYNIIASTAKKGFKTKFYGQRHISFEIVAHRGLVNYYVAAPIVLQDVVRQAVLSAYPSAHTEEVEEHNIFSEVGKIGGTIGGEFELREDYANPIATYQETKRDAMEVLLNSLYNLDSDDGVGIQIMLRPAKAGWSKNALSIAKNKSNGKDKKDSFAKNAGGWLSSVPGALSKVPEFTPGNAAPGGESKDDQPTKLEQSHVEAIEEKTRYPAYETLIRVVASSNTAAKSQSVLAAVTASFSMFDAPGRNGFRFVPAKDIEKFVTAFIFRFFPQKLDKMVLNSVELATVFHLPDQRSTPTSQLQRQQSKQVDGPPNVPDEGLLIGYNEFRGTKKEIRVMDVDRRRHMYILGQTGTGKTVLLKNLVLQDMYEGRGLAYIDPHGDAAEELLELVPKHRVEDVIYFNPGDMEHPMGLNLFEFENEEQKDFLVQEALNMLEKLYDPGNTGIIGPRYHHIFRNCALLLMADPGGSSMIDITKLFRDNNYVQEKLKHTTDENVIEFWTKEIPQSQKSNEFGEVKSWFVSKFGAFLSNEMMRNIIGQTESAFNLRDIMDNKKILIVNLSKGRTGELNSKLLGMIFIMKLQAAAMSRADTPEDEREDFSLYIDEFQNFLTDSIATILSEARKYRLSMVMAHQFVGQLTDDIRDAVFGNVGSYILSRSSPEDADFLVKHTKPVFETDDIIKMPNYKSIAKTLIGGVPTAPFSMNWIPPMGTPNPQLGSALKKLSAAKYGKPRAVVDKEISDRLSVEAPAPAFGAGARAGIGAPANKTPTVPPSPGAPQKSFVDQWLSKKQQAKPPVAPKPAPAPAPAFKPPAAVPQQPYTPPTGPVPPASAPVATNPVLNPATPAPLANVPAPAVPLPPTGPVPPTPMSVPVNPPVPPATPTPASTQR